MGKGVFCMKVCDFLSQVRIDALLTEHEKNNLKIVESGKQFILDFFQPLILECETNQELNPNKFQISFNKNQLTISFNCNSISFYFDSIDEITVTHVVSGLDCLEIHNNKLVSKKFGEELSNDLLERYLDRLFMEIEDDSFLIR